MSTDSELAKSRTQIPSCQDTEEFRIFSNYSKTNDLHSLEFTKTDPVELCTGYYTTVFSVIQPTTDPSKFLRYRQRKARVHPAARPFL